MTNYSSEEKTLLAAAYPIKGAFAAGGAITSVFTGADIRDVDVYFKTRAAFEDAVFSAYDDGLWCVAATKRAVTFSDQNRNIVQLMHFDFFPTAQAIFDAFDYTICMGAYDYDGGQFVLHDDFLRHNSQRFLKFNAGTRYPLASATRVLKYQQRGYTIGKGDMMKIALAVRGVRIGSWEDLKDQIGGAYGDKVVLGKEHTPFSLSAAIEALTVEDAESEPWVVPANDNMPSTAPGLLQLVAQMKGEEYVEPEMDEWGFPIRNAA